MANELNIPGFKHYELDSTYQAKLAAGEVNAKDLSFVKETGKIYTQGGKYGGGLQYAIERTIQVGEGDELTSEQMAYNAETFSMVNNMLPVVIPFMGCVAIPYIDPSKGVVVVPLVMMDLMVMPVYITSNGNIEAGPQKIKDFVFEADPSEQAQFVVAYFSDLRGTSLFSAKEARAYVQHLYNNHYYICTVDVCSKYTSPNEIGVIEYNFGSQRFRRIYSTATGELVKEEEIQLGGSGGGSGNYLEVRELKMNDDMTVTDEQKAYNAETFNKAQAGEAIALSVMGYVLNVLMVTDGYVIFSSVVPNLNSESELLSVILGLYANGTFAIEGYNYCTVDTEMSDESENAVQNKVVKKYIDDALANAGGGGVSEDYVNTAIANAITTTLNTAV